MKALIERLYATIAANKYVIATGLAVLGATILQNEVDTLLADKQRLDRKLFGLREDIAKAERHRAELVDVPDAPDYQAPPAEVTAS